MKNGILLFLFISTLVFACSGEGGSGLFNASGLPKDPEKLVIEWYEGGGMWPESKNIYLSTDSAYWSRWYRDYTQKIYFDVTRDEILSLYQVFIDNDYNSIRQIEEKEVYDRGGTSIRVIADGKYYDKDNSGLTFLHKSDVDEYRTIETAIQDFAARKIASKQMSAQVKFTPALLNSGYTFSLTVNGLFAFSSNKTPLTNGLYETSVYSGLNDFDLAVFNPDSLDYSGNPSYVMSYRLVKDLNNTNNSITFDLENNALKAF